MGPVFATVKTGLAETVFQHPNSAPSAKITDRMFRNVLPARMCDRSPRDSKSTFKMSVGAIVAV